MMLQGEWIQMRVSNVWRNWAWVWRRRLWRRIAQVVHQMQCCGMIVEPNLRKSCLRMGMIVKIICWLWYHTDRLRLIRVQVRVPLWFKNHQSWNLDGRFFVGYFYPGGKTWRNLGKSHLCFSGFWDYQAGILRLWSILIRNRVILIRMMSIVPHLTERAVQLWFLDLQLCVLFPPVMDSVTFLKNCWVYMRNIHPAAGCLTTRSFCWQPPISSLVRLLSLIL